MEGILNETIVAQAKVQKKNRIYQRVRKQITPVYPSIELNHQPNKNKNRILKELLTVQRYSKPQ